MEIPCSFEMPWNSIGEFKYRSGNVKSVELIPESVVQVDDMKESHHEVNGSHLHSSSDYIWNLIKAEAKIEAEKEQILSSYLYASILSHSSLEKALGFVLANRLQNATLLATPLVDIFDDVMAHDDFIPRSIRLDLLAFKDRDPSCLSYSWILLYLKGYQALQSYRIAHVLWIQGHRVLALTLQSRISEVFAVDIHPAARIGEGIFLDHGTGVVIGETAIVGNQVSLMQGVTLGGSGKEVGDRHPKISPNVLIGAAANVLGNINVGQGSVIAAGSLVLKDIPPYSLQRHSRCCRMLMLLLNEGAQASWPCYPHACAFDAFTSLYNHENFILHACTCQKDAIATSLCGYIREHDQCQTT